MCQQRVDSNGTTIRVHQCWQSQRARPNYLMDGLNDAFLVTTWPQNEDYQQKHFEFG
jgi:hypothetical protein